MEKKNLVSFQDMFILLSIHSFVHCFIGILIHLLCAYIAIYLQESVNTEFDFHTNPPDVFITVKVVIVIVLLFSLSIV